MPFGSAPASSTSRNAAWSGDVVAQERDGRRLLQAGEQADRVGAEQVVIDLHGLDHERAVTQDGAHGIGVEGTHLVALTHDEHEDLSLIEGLLALLGEQLLDAGPLLLGFTLQDLNRVDAVHTAELDEPGVGITDRVVREDLGDQRVGSRHGLT